MTTSDVNTVDVAVASRVITVAPSVTTRCAVLLSTVPAGTEALTITGKANSVLPGTKGAVEQVIVPGNDTGGVTQLQPGGAVKNEPKVVPGGRVSVSVADPRLPPLAFVAVRK